MDLKDIEFNELVIEWLRYHLPKYIDKNVPILVANEIDKIPAAISIANAYIENNELNIELTSNEVINLGSIKGDKGERGFDGVGIKDIAITNGNLLITLDNGKQFDVGNVIGAKGEQGEQGERGESGLPPEHRYIEKDNCIQFKQPDGEWGICIPIEDKRTVKMDNYGGTIGQPIVQKLSTLYNNILIESFTQTIDFTGSVDVTKVQDKFVRVQIGLIWETLTADTVLENNKGYVVDGNSQLNLTLPDNCDIGDTIEILMGSVEGFRLVAPSGIDFFMGKKEVVNYLENVSGQINSSITIKCNYANLKYIVTSSMGNFTIN